VASMGEEKQMYKVLVGVCGLDSTGSGQGPVVGCCKCGDEPSGSRAMELVGKALFVAAAGLKTTHSILTSSRIYGVTL
jgi:hypothetical protein